jgi:hypothetical protein
MRMVKVGNMVETNTGHTGLVLDMEMLYPGHPCSPVRNYIIMWNDTAPRYAVLIGENKISKVDAFTIKKLKI